MNEMILVVYKQFKAIDCLDWRTKLKASTGFEPMTNAIYTNAMLYQLSYEALIRWQVKTREYESNHLVETFHSLDGL